MHAHIVHTWFNIITIYNIDILIVALLFEMIAGENISNLTQTIVCVKHQLMHAPAAYLVLLHVNCL